MTQRLKVLALSSGVLTLFASLSVVELLWPATTQEILCLAMYLQMRHLATHPQDNS